MKTTWEGLDALFDRALAQFLVAERDLIFSNVREEALCVRLGFPLERERIVAGLDGYYVDVEYDRKQNGEVKTIIKGKGKVVKIIADLLLHSRGELKKDNLIAVEMKKESRSEKDKQLDRERLIAMTSVPYKMVWSANGVAHPEHVCGYELGVFIELDVRRGLYMTEKYRLGRHVMTTCGSFGEPPTRSSQRSLWPQS